MPKRVSKSGIGGKSVNKRMARRPRRASDVAAESAAGTAGVSASVPSVINTVTLACGCVKDRDKGERVSYCKTHVTLDPNYDPEKAEFPEEK